MRWRLPWGETVLPAANRVRTSAWDDGTANRASNRFFSTDLLNKRNGIYRVDVSGPVLQQDFPVQFDPLRQKPKLFRTQVSVDHPNLWTESHQDHFAGFGFWTRGYFHPHIVPGIALHRDPDDEGQPGVFGEEVGHIEKRIR